RRCSNREQVVHPIVPPHLRETEAVDSRPPPRSCPRESASVYQRKRTHQQRPKRKRADDQPFTRSHTRRRGGREATSEHVSVAFGELDAECSRGYGHGPTRVGAFRVVAIAQQRSPRPSNVVTAHCRGSEQEHGGQAS